LEVISILFARMSDWKFKAGQRDQAIAELDKDISSQARQSEGYRGSMVFLSKEDSDSAIIITLWADENAMQASSKAVFTDAIKTIEQYTVNPPNVRNFKLSEAEVRL
jgi:quinol monooxygenase YgiN